MEIEGRWILQAATKAVREVDEAAAALLDFAGAERIDELFEPKSVLDLRRLGVECMRRGTELVFKWDGDCLQGLLEIDAGPMKSFRSAVAEARYSSEPMSEAIRLTKYFGVAGVGVRYISKQELSEMILKAGNQPRRIGVPASWIAGKKHIPVHRGAGM